MNTDMYHRAREFIYRNARPIDLARWKYHFEEGCKEAALDCLLQYQNEDGGFGHALEPDAWNPHSSPIQTWQATEILREIEFTQPDHPLIKGILRYLGSGANSDGHFWYNAIRSNNDYPHAPWWHAEQDSTDNESYNPTACLAGFVIRFADKQSDLYEFGRRLAQSAFAQLVNKTRENDMNTIHCYIRLMEYCCEAQVHDVIDLDHLKRILTKLVNKSITLDTCLWEKSYICKPSQFFSTTDSLFYHDNMAIAEYECEHIIHTQQDDGAWGIPWKWNDYPEQWAISKNWWKSHCVIRNLLYLKGMKRDT